LNKETANKLGKNMIKQIILDTIKKETILTENQLLKFENFSINGSKEVKIPIEFLYKIIKELISENKVEYKLYTVDDIDTYSIFIDAEKNIKFL